MKIANVFKKIIHGRPDGTLSDGDEAEVLSLFFGSIFTEEGNGPIPQFGPRDVTQLNELKVSEEDIAKKLKSLNISKSPGPDNVHPRVLKELAEELAIPLKLLLDKTLKERKIPDKWKEAEV